jgi:hypothetical protein
MLPEPCKELAILLQGWLGYYMDIKMYLKRLGEWLRCAGTATILETLDNGKEFAAHKSRSQTLTLDIYITHPHPYHLWEQGLNEHTNVLLGSTCLKKHPLIGSPQNSLTKSLIKTTIGGAKF